MAYADYNDNSSTAEVAQQQLHQNLSKISSNLDIDEDGYVLGFKIPKSLQPVVQAGIENVKPFLVDKTEFINQGAQGVAKAVGVKNEGTRKIIGTTVESGVRWGIIGAQQLIGSLQASNTYRRERAELNTTFASVSEATGVNSSNNSVLRHAYQEATDGWRHQMKLIAASLPTLAPLVMYGVKAQREANAKLQNEFKNTGAPSATTTSVPTDPYHLAEQKVAEHREKFINENLGKPGYGNDAEAVGRIFDERRYDRVMDYYLNGGVDGLKQLDKPEDDKDNGGILKGLVGGASVISEILKINLQEGAAKRNKDLKAWKMIEHMAMEVKNQCHGEYRPAGSIHIMGRGNLEGYEVSLKDAIIEIFQQHERDLESEKNPSKNFRREDGSLISPLGAPLVAKLEPAAEKIAEAIANGLDASALYVLVGGDAKGEKIITHGKDGAKTFAAEARVNAVLDDMIAALGSCDVVKPDEYYSVFTDPKGMQKTIKNTLNNLKGRDQALFAAILPEEILKQAGVKKSQITMLRKRAYENDDLYTFVAANARHLASHSPDELKKLGGSEQDIEALRAFVDKLEAGDKDALLQAIDGRDKTLLNTISALGLLEQTKGGSPEYWTNRVKELTKLRPLLDAAFNSSSNDVSDEMDKGPRRKFSEEIPFSAMDTEAGYIDREAKRRSARDDSLDFSIAP